MRIALVNDVVTAIEAMRRVIISNRDNRLAWIAHDGAEALDLCARDTPDLILMDLIMPRMDGVEATRRIMARTPCAIVVVTANVMHRTSKVFEAMGAGALDAVNTPVFEPSGARGGGDALLAKIETIRKLIGPDRGGSRPAGPQPAARHPVEQGGCLIGIGASAGGPTALAKVLAHLPADFAASVVIVQHVDAQFAAGLASWLDNQSPLRVRLAREGDRPEAGTALLAGEDSHLVFANSTRLTYVRQPADCVYRPSVDIFFQSVARFWQGDVIGIVLSGMGRDGAEGLRSLHSKGHHTIAQDRLSSAAYGMPAAAAELRAATEILALDKIGPRLRNIVLHKTKTHGRRTD
jgi:two-component system, chemotaxis family, response regulator WspF